jgi:hypothetical protein
MLLVVCPVTVGLVTTGLVTSPMTDHPSATQNVHTFKSHSIRTHKKSYTGCRACKARKVKVLLPSFECLLCLLSICLKCDEVKPVCGKCSVHFKNTKSCDYGPSPRLKKKEGYSKKKDVVSKSVAPPTWLQSNEPLPSEGELTTAAFNPLHSLQSTRKRAAGPTTVMPMPMSMPPARYVRLKIRIQYRIICCIVLWFYSPSTHTTIRQEMVLYISMVL